MVVDETFGILLSHWFEFWWFAAGPDAVETALGVVQWSKVGPAAELSKGG